MLLNHRRSLSRGRWWGGGSQPAFCTWSRLSRARFSCRVRQVTSKIIYSISSSLPVSLGLEHLCNPWLSGAATRNPERKRLMNFCCGRSSVSVVKIFSGKRESFFFVLAACMSMRRWVRANAAYARHFLPTFSILTRASFEATTTTTSTLRVRAR